ncbi:MAG TPA: aminotransferase class V-fold PLP-dependent enzyme [Steroidobacteraceae bacterium]|nr:aminotransferase class V-fold PLP-dependent enzyme [Steroidobacteraceae bacterium]
MKPFHSSPLHQVSRRQALAMGIAGAGAAISATVRAQMVSDADSSSSLAAPWQALRAQLVLNPKLAYFDTATAGPATRAVLAAEYRALESLHTEEQDFYSARYNTQAVQQLCNRVASWLGCSRDELTLTRGAQAGIEQFATSFDFQPALQAGDELVLCNQLPATSQSFWARWGRQRGLSIKTVMLPSPLLNDGQVTGAFNAALSERCRIVVFSHVQHSDGAILPVRELCTTARNNKTISIVDGTLALGAMNVSMMELDCDVYASSFHHWMNGPQHTGVLYVRRTLLNQVTSLSHPLIDMLDLNIASWPALIAKLPKDFIDYAPQFQALMQSLSLQEGLGRNVVAARIRELCSYARLQLQSTNMQIMTPVPGQMWSNILTVRAANPRVAELVNYLRRTDQVVVGGINIPNGSLLRMSFHIYNSLDDVDRLLRGVSRAMRL